MNTTARQTVTGEISPARFARLTSHLKINGKPIESILHRWQDEKRAEPPPNQEPP